MVYVHTHTGKQIDQIQLVMTKDWNRELCEKQN